MMFRPVSADHVLFKECIPAFRPLDFAKPACNRKQGLENGYLLLSFELTQELALEHFVIQPTHTVDFPGGRAAFVAPVTLPPWLEGHYAHLFTTALSVVVSFATGRPASSPRDSYLSGSTLSERDLTALGVQFPVLIAGPGAHHQKLSQETTTAFHQAIAEIVSLLFKLPYKRYEQVLRAIRLVQLAHLNRKLDFALAYFLFISAIECVAALAIKRDVVKDRPSEEQVWRQIAESEEDVKELLEAYRELRGQNKYLGRRFVEFILKYCPVSSWDQMPHPFGTIISHLGETTEGIDISWVTRKQWYEVYPSDLPLDLPEGSPLELQKYTIRKILSDAYDHRSRFAHEGRTPPHQTPVSHNKYFDIDFLYNSRAGGVEQLILPNLHLIAFIAQRSILAYAKSQLGTVRCCDSTNLCG